MRAVAPGPDGRPNSCRCSPAKCGASRPASSRSPGSTRHSKVTRWRSAVQPIHWASARPPAWVASVFGRKGLTQRMFILMDRGPYLL